MSRWLLILIFLACSTPDEIELKYPFQDASSLISKEETQFVQLFNNYRSKLKLPLLKVDATATYLIKQHCKWMIENDTVSHYEYADRSLYLKSIGAKRVGEIISYGQGNVEKSFNAFKNSDGHKPYLDNPNYNACGICVKERYYALILFGI